MVNGTSINRVAQDGDIPVVVDSVLSPRAGDLVIAVRTRAGLQEVTAKRFWPADDMIELRYNSTDVRYGGVKPIRFSNGGNSDDDTQIEIKGVVLGVWRPTI